MVKSKELKVLSIDLNLREWGGWEWFLEHLVDRNIHCGVGYDIIHEKYN